MAQIERVIYSGPSLYGVEVQRFPGELWLPPAKCGDILEAALGSPKPQQILLIDGVFHQSLSVWHKELVYALLEGIVCIGAASMGALRAAELWRYGMIGIGEIFERYKAGEEDDSLVAMTFDERTFRPLQHASLQHLKADDALSAIQFARSYTGTVETTLDRSSITPYLKLVIDRIYAG